MTTPPIMTINDELLAELEAECETRVTIEIGRRAMLALLQHVRELKADAARLDFMLNEQCIMQSQNGSMSPVVYSLYWPHTGEQQIEWHKSKREALDQAMIDAARSSAD